MNNSTKFLMAAKERIDTPNKWCQKSAIDAVDRRCTISAMVETGKSLRGYDEAMSLLKLSVRRSGWRSLIDMNDNEATTHAVVMEVFDDAIHLSV